ncbi:hypothetical protein FEM54_00160 [Pseudomonas edaphica]|uniref:Secreted protein n=1 Tax=Pseudomonas edaphica TaxID=2006980 RepID=A0ABY2UCW4_9PSED|nr:hypothetical protein FEM54_00160 [Pseudomonas edaphica]
MSEKRLLWRGSLLPLDCAAVPQHFASASHSSGSKLPRHNEIFLPRKNSAPRETASPHRECAFYPQGTESHGHPWRSSCRHGR